MRIVTTKEMKQIEKNANDMGMSYYDMMENAGTATADCIRKNTKDFESKIYLICVGTGNNGGDGYVVARKIKEYGGNPIIMMIGGTPKTPDAITNFNKAQECGIEIIEFEPKVSMPVIFGSDVIVDAVYGTGFHGELTENVKSLFELTNDSDAIKYSIDIPSGVSADDGRVASSAFKADFTIAIDSMKNAHVMSDTIDICGRVVCVDIGIPKECSMLK